MHNKILFKQTFYEEYPTFYLNNFIELDFLNTL